MTIKVTVRMGYTYKDERYRILIATALQNLDTPLIGGLKYSDNNNSMVAVFNPTDPNAIEKLKAVLNIYREDFSYHGIAFDVEELSP